MRIGLINENSQADKNTLICKVLNDVASKYGHEVINFGKFSKDEKRNLPYTHVGLLASILYETKIVDFIVTGCGTGQGASISCNAFPNLVCGIISSPLDMALFTQINAGNVVSIPYAEKFGWGSELELSMIFEECFKNEFGKGYPQEYAESEKKSRLILQKEIKEVICNDMLSLLKRFNKHELESLLSFPEFKEAFVKYAEKNEVTDYVQTLLK